MDARKRSACYPRGSFYPLSPVPPTRDPRITNTHFRASGILCFRIIPARLVSPFGDIIAWVRPVRLTVKLACRVCTTRPGFHSGLANLCTPPLLFWRQPPQLNCPPDSVLLPDFYAGVSKISPFRRVVFHCPRTNFLRNLRGSHLYSTVKIESSVSRCSKAPRGLFVQVQVGRIFTAISISPGNGSRQSLRRATFRAGRNFNSEILESDYIFTLSNEEGIPLYTFEFLTHSCYTQFQLFSALQS